MGGILDQIKGMNPQGGAASGWPAPAGGFSWFDPLTMGGKPSVGSAAESVGAGGGLGSIPGLDEMWGGGLGSIPDAWREDSGIPEIVKSTIDDPLITDCGFEP
jgi:hypothetical protein